MPDRRPNRVLVPLDGSVLAEHALPYALAWAAQAGATELVLVRVARPAAAEDRCRDSLESLASRLRERSGLPCQCVVLTGEPATKLLELTEEASPSLLVLTSHGYTGSKRFLLGSVAEKLARRATCPVMVVRGLRSQAVARPDLSVRPSFEPVLVPVDGSANSERALSFCARHRFLTGHVVLLRATDYRFGFDPREEDLRDRIVAEIRLDLARLLDRYRETIPGLQVEVQEDVAAEGILYSCEVHRARLVVLAPSNRNPVERFFLGSVAERVLHHAECPVLLLPPRALLPRTEPDRSLSVPGRAS